jgi:hypothetical protein
MHGKGLDANAFKVNTVETLIDKAVKKCGSAYRLAKLTGTSQGAISHMISGGREIPPTLAAELAEIVGDDPKEAALAAIVAKEKRPERRAHLLEIFGLKGGINGAL